MGTQDFPGKPLLDRAECTIRGSFDRLFVELRAGGIILAGYQRHESTVIGWKILQHEGTFGDVDGITCESGDTDEPVLTATTDRGVYRAVDYLYGDRHVVWLPYADEHPSTAAS
jgi:hypothetical protein